MAALDIVLSPIISMMEFLLANFFNQTGSYGLAIILLSIVVRLALMPVAKLGRRYEEKEAQLQLRMAPAINEIKSKYSGRQQFEQIASVYQDNRYHPIHSMVVILPLFLQIPFLLSALFLLVDYPGLSGRGFFVVSDLSLPDHLLKLDFIVPGLAISLLPLFLTGVAALEAVIKKGATPQSRMRYFIVALVLLALIYPLPASVCLYWLASNLWSLLASATSRMLSD